MKSIICKKNSSIKGFTLVELIVVISILVILGTIAFISFSDYSKNARDSVRVTDISNIKKVLEIFHLKTGYYPTPSGPSKTVSYSGMLAFTEGSFGDSMGNMGYISKKPMDPRFSDIEYNYSILANRDKYQLASVLEGGAGISFVPKAFANSAIFVYVAGNYASSTGSVTLTGVDIPFPLPSITTSDTRTEDVDYSSLINSGAFLGNNTSNDIPFSYKRWGLSLLSFGSSWWGWDTDDWVDDIHSSPAPFVFTDVYSAITDTVYTWSITVSWLGAWNISTANITNGTLYKNGIDMGTSATIQEGDILTISLTSAATTNTTVSATLTIGTMSDSFDVRTAITASMYVSTSRWNDTSGNGSLANPYKTISKGISMVALSGSIFVEKGVYGVSVNLNKAGVILMGENPDNTTITIGGSSNTVNLAAAGVTVQGFRIINTNWLNPVNITANQATVLNNVIQGGDIGVYSTAVWAFVINNTIVGTASRAIYGNATSFAALKNNIIYGNNYGIEGVWTLSIANKWYNTFFGNSVNYVNYTAWAGDIVADPKFELSSYRLRTDSPGIDSGTGTSASLMLDTSSTLFDGTLDSGTVDRGAHYMGSYTSNYRTIYVSKSGSGTNTGFSPASPKLTIASALTLAQDGDRIYVSSGSYNESITISKSNIRLIGENPDNTTITHLGASNTINITAIGVTVQGLRIINAVNSTDAITITANQTTVFNNVIQGGYHGITSTARWASIINNTMVGARWRAIYGNADSFISFKNNIIYGNNYGIEGVSSLIIANKWYNIFFGNSVNYLNYTAWVGDLVADPKFELSSYRLRTDSPAIDSGTGTSASLKLDTMATFFDGTLDSGTVDRGAHYMGLYGSNYRNIYVAKNWSAGNTGLSPASPKLTIASALTLAQDGDRIYVSSGSYSESITVSKSNINLIGENPEKTTITIGGTSNTVNISAIRVTIQGFRIINASGNAIEISANQATISNNLIQGWSIGIYSPPGIEKAFIINNTIIEATWRGIYGSSTSFISLKNNILYGNYIGIDGVVALSIAEKGYNTLFGNTTNYINYTPGTGDVVADPKFEPSSYRLRTDSPCIDSGTGTAAFLRLDTMSTLLSNTLDTGTVDRGVHH